MVVHDHFNGSHGSNVCQRRPSRLHQNEYALSYEIVPTYDVLYTPEQEYHHKPMVPYQHPMGLSLFSQSGYNGQSGGSTMTRDPYPIERGVYQSGHGHSPKY
ncbi:hypothetical protein CBS101457_003221 [Exobasidium rhododendri]|nr:hypothetical protein CBS101457_003221 [Exobasidium rhododendri]